MTLCAYCGDPAKFGRLDGTGHPFCDVCVGIGVADPVIEPGSTRHRCLRPYTCAICKKWTASPVACARPACIEAGYTPSGNVPS